MPTKKPSTEDMPSQNVGELDLEALIKGDWSQCRALLLHTYTSSKNEQRPAISPENLTDLLSSEKICQPENILLTVSKLLDAVESLDHEQLAILKFTDQLFDNFLINCRLHSSLHPLLNAFRPVVAKILLQQQLPWQDSHPLAQIIHCLYSNALGWQPEQGRAAERFLQQLGNIILPASNSIDEKLLALEQFFAGESQRINKLEKRLYDAETGALHTRHAQQLSAKTLNQQMAGKKLPAVISQFLQGPWRDSMQLMILSQGKDSDGWRQILKLTETLIWSFQPFDKTDSEYQQHVYQSISEISEELRGVALGLHHSSKLDEELAAIEREHLNILRGAALDYAAFQLIENKDPLLNSQVSISSNLVKQAGEYSEGQWFIDSSDHSDKRIKLSIKLPQAQQLLFTNFLGIKSAQYNYEEFAYLLSSKLMVPLPGRAPFQATGEKIITTLQDRYKRHRQQAAAEAIREAEQRQQQEQERQAAREKALREARAHAEAQKAAQLKARKEEEQLRQQQVLEQREKSVYQQLSQLAIGGIISFRQTNQSEHCKLAAIIQSTGDYIFVNRQGIKQESLNRSQLARRLLDGSAKLIDIGSNFDNTLETVVNGLRTRNNK